MSEFKGTPGPWVVDEESFMVTDGSGEFIAEFDNGRWDEDHANADLIAEAPELLEVLKEILRDNIIVHSQRVKANSIIAKALGESK